MKSIVTDPKATSTGIFSVRTIEHKEPGGYDKEEKEEEKEVHVVKRVNIHVHVAVDSARLSSWIFVQWLSVFMIIF